MADPGPTDSSAGKGTGKVIHDGLMVRLASALILIPVSLTFVVLGGWPFLISLVFVTSLMAFEWNRLVLGPENSSKLILFFVIYSAFLVGALALGLEGHWQAALGLTAFAALLTLVVGLQQKVRAFWPFIGLPYLFLPMMAFIWLRGADDGIVVIVWLLLVVWGSDSGGYIFGKWLGGPKLAPKISPNKTWSGFIGGMVLAMTAGLVTALYVGEGSVLTLVLVSAVLSTISQLGDLVESSVKRHFGVKDFSGFIPGHGGVLDRFDGLLFTLFAAALIQLNHNGSILNW